MGDEKKTIFHSFVMKKMFLTKRGRADVQHAISSLALRVKESRNQYCMKKLRVLCYLKCKRDDLLSLEADNEKTLYSQRGLVVPSKILRYFPSSGSLVQDRRFESLRTFGREDCKFSGPRAVANSRAAG